MDGENLTDNRASGFLPTLRYAEYQENVGGRPSRLTEEFAARIADEVRMGASPRRAAALCGIPRRTWDGWVQKHGQGVEPYRSRIEVILIAQASWEACGEQFIAGAGKWEGVAWLLKTRNRTEYGDKIEVKHDASDPAQLTRDELMRIAAGKA